MTIRTTWGEPAVDPRVAARDRREYRAAEYALERAGYRRETATVNGYGLRRHLENACEDVADEIGAEVLATPEVDYVHFRGTQARTKARRTLPGRGGEMDEIEHVARIVGAIRAAADQGAPTWLVRELSCSYEQPFHQCGESRTWEARGPAIDAWQALALAGYSWGRLLRRMDAVRAIIARRHPSIARRVSRRDVIAALATGRGVKNAVPCAVITAAYRRGLVVYTTKQSVADLATALAALRLSPTRERLVRGSFWWLSEAELTAARTAPIRIDSGIAAIDLEMVRTLGSIEVRKIVGRELHTIILHRSSGESYHGGWDTERAIRDAIQAFRARWRENAKRRREEAERAAEEALLSSVEVLVYTQDSYAVGNCVEGTRGFASQNGFLGRPFVPARELASFEGRPEVARVLSYARRDLVRRCRQDVTAA